MHRGTPERPGLVLGLDRGGSCHGMAFEIAASDWDDTLAHFRAREQVTMVYLEKRTTVRLLSSGQKIEAVTYVVDRHHRQYAGVLTEDAILSHVLQGEGVSGRWADYAVSTLEHLREMNIHDKVLESLAVRLRNQAATSKS